MDVSTVRKLFGKFSSQPIRAQLSQKQGEADAPCFSAAENFYFNGFIMVSTETHESQDLLAPTQTQDPDQDQNPLSTMAGFDTDKISQGSVHAITVLTLLDKLVNMLDTVQENQHKMEVRRV